jgi:4-hydroxybenzoate polyprenyltransferase
VSLRAAWNWLFALSLVGLLVLIQLPPLAQGIALLSLALVAGYPFMKRITWWPQAWLGLTFNWGALVACAAVAQAVGLPALLLYAAGVFWTLGYDTIYALQDIEDDALAGIRSSARALKGNVRLGVAIFYALSAVLLAGALALVGGPLAALAALPAAAHLAWQLRRLDAAPATALRLFRSNSWAGALVFLACAVAGT